MNLTLPAVLMPCRIPAGRIKNFALCMLLLLPAGARAELLVRVTAEEIVGRLRQEGVAVCFERVHNQKADALTLEEQIEVLEKIPDGERTERERDLLKTLLRLKQDGNTPGHSVVNWKQKQFNFEFPFSVEDPAEVLKDLEKADPDYAWERSGSRYLVYPKKGSFNRPLQGFKAENLKFWDFVRASGEQISKPAGLNQIFVVLGRDWTEDYKNGIYTLELGATDTRTALTRFADAIGPAVVWNVIGCEPDWLNLSFGPVRKRDPQ